MEKIEGTLGAYIDENTEEIRWGIKAYGYRGYNSLEEGQTLVIYDDSNNVYWGGNIKKDLTAILPNSTFQSKVGQVVTGADVRWLQEDVRPEKWASMFLENMRAEVHLDDQLKDDTVFH